MPMLRKNNLFEERKRNIMKIRTTCLMIPALLCLGILACSVVHGQEAEPGALSEGEPAAQAEEAVQEAPPSEPVFHEPGTPVPQPEAPAVEKTPQQLEREQRRISPPSFPAQGTATMTRRRARQLGKAPAAPKKEEKVSETSMDGLFVPDSAGE